jgi:hypothetical protein
MPNLHEMGGENAAMIAAQLKEVTATRRRPSAPGAS